MGLGNYTDGWGAVDDYENNEDARGNSGNGEGGGISEADRLYKFRFQIPEPDPKPDAGGKIKRPNLVNPGKAATKRVLFLKGVPYTMFEHSYWKMHGAFELMNAYTGACLKKNKGIEGWDPNMDCPMCAKNGGDRYPYFIGFFPIIDMGQVEYASDGLKLHHDFWVNKDGQRFERPFQKQLLGAKYGSNDKPGVLKTLKFEMEQLKREHGWNDLTGTVWDTTRMGKKSPSVGDSWRFVKRLDPSEFEDYLVSFGANRDELNIEVPILGLDKQGSALYVDPDIHYEKLSKLVGWGAQRSDNNRATTEGAGFGREEDARGGPQVPPDDNDIPF